MAATSASLTITPSLTRPVSQEQQQGLETRLTEANLELEAAKASLCQPVESIEVTDALFDIAEDCDVEITELSSFFTTGGELEGVALSTLPIRIRIEGHVSDLIRFILRWTEQYPTGVVSLVGITLPTIPTTIPEGGEAAEEEEGWRPSADLELFIYTYEGN